VQLGQKCGNIGQKSAIRQYEKLSDLSLVFDPHKTLELTLKSDMSRKIRVRKSDM